ncbi:DUF4148 domain-containing protein [Paraburkholderia phenoliruptrix]|uniref:DUF4148 domain-containing protein n=1 Tax=Paraburkholderia phenoliruptrix TaxID=252970 RepID=UPI0001C02BE1|nr:DUF4148 domain-containing protein [Paraburkholderia phenoliruptrix]MDR6391401.1 hypothetical protein [Paraburkholderia phenoliruptrix]WMY11833.1 DUF4148 domain-containing protein [Paraburkholderia phenoliruptrix]
MKFTMIASAFAASALTASAFAATLPEVHTSGNDAQQSAQWSAAQNPPKARTRAEVRQELVRAEKDGQLAALNKLYQGS